MIPHFSGGHSFTFFLSKDSNLLIRLFWHWFFSYLTISFFLFQIFHSFTTSFTSIILFIFCFWVISSLFLLFIFPTHSLSLLSFAFSTSIFSVLASTAYHTLLYISSSLSLLFSNQFQSCDVQVIAYPRQFSNFVLLLYKSLFSFYISYKIYLFLLYFSLATSC